MSKFQFGGYYGFYSFLLFSQRKNVRSKKLITEAKIKIKLNYYLYLNPDKYFSLQFSFMSLILPYEFIIAKS
jgi:hypothetical protein